MSRRPSIPPIRVGSKRVTYTPPGPNDISRYNRLMFRCEILRLWVDSTPVQEIDGEHDYYKHDVRADLLLPDGTTVHEVPYTDVKAENGASWCRPWITSMSFR